MNRSAIIVSLIGLALVVILFLPWKKTPKLDLTFKKAGTIQIMDTVGTLKTSFDFELADTDEKREQGLMYRESLEPNHGMLFVMEEEEVHGFWMIDTYIPLDIIFINEAKEIVYIAKAMEPESQEPVNSKAPCLYALEVNAGLAESFQIEVGDKVKW